MVLNNAVNASTTGFQSLNSATGVWNGRTLTPGAGITITNQDGTGGNPVIAATGGVPSPLDTLTIADDFIYSLGSANPTGNLNWIRAGVNGSTNGTAAHPGIISIGSAGTAGSIMMSGSTDGASSWPFVLGGGSFTIDFIVNITATNNATTIFGLGAGTIGAEPTDGVYFLYNSGVNSGNWVGKTANASTRTSANSAVAIVGGTFVHLQITINAAGTSCGFFVNGVQIASSPITTNIPTAALDLRAAVTASAGGNAAQVDFVQLINTLSVSRA